MPSEGLWDADASCVVWTETEKQGAGIGRAKNGKGRRRRLEQEAPAGREGKEVAPEATVTAWSGLLKPSG